MFLANAGLPSLFFYTPAALLMLIPIILFQAFLGRRHAELPFTRSLAVSAAANALSTAVGFPLAALPALLGLRLAAAGGLADDFSRALYAVAVQAPWLFPFRGHMVCLLPAAAIGLTLPFLLATLLLQCLLTGALCPHTPRRQLWRWLWRANLAAWAIVPGLILLSYWLNPFWEAVAAVFHPLIQPVIDCFPFTGR